MQGITRGLESESATLLPSRTVLSLGAQPACSCICKTYKGYSRSNSVRFTGACMMFEGRVGRRTLGTSESRFGKPSIVFYRRGPVSTIGKYRFLSGSLYRFLSGIIGYYRKLSEIIGKARVLAGSLYRFCAFFGGGLLPLFGGPESAVSPPGTVGGSQAARSFSG